MNEEYVNQLREMLQDRFTAEELSEILGLESVDVFDKFTEECLGIDWGEHL